jgi:hypothetical protein
MAEVKSTAEEFGLGAIDQISYAVQSVGKSLPDYERLFGAFSTRTVELPDLWFRGRKTQAVLTLAFGRSGALEIELVEPVSGDFPQVGFLQQHGEGLHHVRYIVSDLEDKLALMESHGYRVVMRGVSPGVRFSYLEAPSIMGDCMIELLQREDG